MATPGAGALVLSQRAIDVLGEFLGRRVRRFYNVTSLVKCVDVERSAKGAIGAIAAETFYDLNVPLKSAVFKDLLTEPMRLYVNDSDRELLESSPCVDG